MVVMQSYHSTREKYFCRLTFDRRFHIIFISKMITIANVGNCTPFQLRYQILQSYIQNFQLFLLCYCFRQELVKRNCFDLDEEKVCHRTLLQRLMVELVMISNTNDMKYILLFKFIPKVKEESVVQEERVLNAINSNYAEREAKKLEREKKKQEAIERSIARQNNDADYFKKKYAINEEKKVTSEGNLDESVGDTEDISSDNISKEDPFRNYVSKQRSKIFVK